MAALAILFLMTIEGIAQSKVAFVRLTSVIQPTSQKRQVIFYCNPLLLDNKPFNYTDFSVTSRGILTVVTGNPETTDVEKIPFRIYLRRNGKTINRGASDTTRAVTTIDIASVLAIAKPGDNLIIDPVRKSDVKAKRSIKLKDYFFNTNLFSFIKNKDDDC